jgi:signal transduction histidine kinase
MLQAITIGLCALLLIAWLRSRRRWAVARRTIHELEGRLREAHDEANRQRAVLEAQEKLTSLGMLAAGVAHEINNPMSYVTSNVRGLAEELQGLEALPHSLREYADELLPATLDGIARVNAIVADLRAFSRADSGKNETFDLNEQVAAALRIAGSQFSRNVEVRKCLGKLPPAHGRPQQITQVLVNLLVNAAQAISDTGVVSVATRCDPDELTVEVRDTGVGMRPETISNLFKPFFTTKGVGAGTGLGLAVAHGIVRRHGGRIEVRSTPGEGSAFSVHLPRPRTPSRPRGPSSAPLTETHPNP